MGCFGLGVTRILAASVEVLSSATQLQWPRTIAPYKLILIPQKVNCCLMISGLQQSIEACSSSLH